MRTGVGICLLFLFIASVQARGAESNARVRVPWTTSRVVGSPDPPLPYKLERVYPNLKLESLVDLVLLPGSDRWVAVTQYGALYSFRAGDTAVAKPDLFVDLKKELRGLDKVPGAKGVRESYAIAFHPKFAENRYCYVCIILDVPVPGPSAERGSRISRFKVTDTDPPRIDPASEQVMIEWLGGGHNGCSLHFGRDGYLYFSTGDAANPSPPDGLDTGQDLDDLLSCVVRIDVDRQAGGKPYGIPPDNPFKNMPGARPEIFAYGFRNPWRMSFDRQTGDLWVADVGWELWEMVYRVENGGNYGWSVMEGPQPVRPDAKRGPTPIQPPALSLPHSDAASITGGYVYRGKKLPNLAGQYVFGDWETRRVWASKVEPDGKLGPYRRIADTDKRVVSFAEDRDGELYVMSYEEGMIFRIVPNDEAGPNGVAGGGAFPRKLSETGLFASVLRYEPAPGVLPFAVNAAQWNDGATADRFVAIPGAESLRREDNHHVYPKDSVLVRTFSLPRDADDSRPPRRVETQLLHFNGLRWNGYTYRWNDQQTDADLVDAAGGEQKLAVPDPAAPGKTREKTWRFPSRAQCATCHNSFAEFALAFTVPQLDRGCDPRLAAPSENQVHLLREVKVLPAAQRVRGDPTPPPPAPPLTDPRDASADAEARARSYLHVNCSHCHRFGGGGSALIDLRYDIPLKETKAVGQRPNLGDFGIPGAQIIAPGDPARSVLLYRMAKLGRGRMPHIGSYEVDRDALLMMEQWIRQIPGDSAGAASEARTAEEKALESLRPAKSLDAEASEAIGQLLSSTSGALALLLDLDAGRLPPFVRDEVIRRGPEAPLESVRDLYERFLPPERIANRLGPTVNPQAILSLAGDAARGREVFFGAAGAAAGTALCAQCHQVAGKGESFGPDLSQVGTKYDRAKMLEQILDPSKVIDPQFVTHVARTAKGEDFVGLLVRRDDKEVVLKDAQQKKEIRLPASEVKRLVAQTVSVMPENLLSGLTAQQAADLVEFLQQQK